MILKGVVQPNIKIHVYPPASSICHSLYVGISVGLNVRSLSLLTGHFSNVVELGGPNSLKNP